MNAQKQEKLNLPRWLKLRCMFRAGLVGAAATRGKPSSIGIDPRTRGIERRGVLQWK